MNAQLIATLVDQSLSIIGGVLATLIGFRFFGPKPSANEKFDSMHGKWLKHFRWLGPLLIAVACLKLVLSQFAGNVTAETTVSKKKMLQVIQENLSAEGKTAQHDQLIQSPDGFKVLIPEGFTYSKPPETPLSLAAAYDIQGAATPTFSVTILNLDSRLDQFVENTKTTLIARNNTTKFSTTQATDRGQVKLFHTSMASQRNGVNVKGGMLFFENGGKAFILTYGTHEGLFNASEPVFEKITSSFGP